MENDELTESEFIDYVKLYAEVAEILAENGHEITPDNIHDTIRTLAETDD